MGRRREDAIDLAGIGVGIGREPGPIHRQVVGRLRPQLRSARAHCAKQIDHRLQRFVAHLDQLGGILRNNEGLGDDHGDRFAHMHHPLAGERRPVRNDELLAAPAGEGRMASDIADAGGLHVGGGQDGEHALGAPRPLHVDRADVGKGMRGSHEPAEGLVLLVAVGDEMAGAAHQGVVLDARKMVCAAGSRI